MHKLAFVTVHGMGETLPDYADRLWANIIERRAGAVADIAFAPVYYQQILQDNEATVWSRIDAQSKVHYDSLRKFLLYGFGDAAGLENRKEDDGSVYELAQIEIARTLLAVRERAGGDVPLVLLAHSLGCQVISSYIYDAQKSLRAPVVVGIWKNIQQHALAISGRPQLTPEELAFLRCQSCRALMTTGCNIPIFVAAHRDMHIVPIAPPNGGPFTWLNLYDPDDVLGWPLQPLSAGYRVLVEDRPINAGRGMVDWILKSWNPLSHTVYWDDEDVLRALLTLLAA